MTTAQRRLQRAHFAFMRALLQGMDERQSWDRYLRMDGDSTDLRAVRRTIAWIRDEFAAAARRAARPGTARLVLMDPGRLAEPQQLPTLEAFALEHGLEDFSAAEQIEAYEQAFPAARSAGRRGRQRPGRRARLIERQLEALRWLEGQVARDPRPGDSVAAWLNPAVAQRLSDAGLPTLGLLVQHINARGDRWWRQVPGVGAGKAARVMQWLLAQAPVEGLRVAAHAAVPRCTVSPATLEAVVPRSTALVPLEKLQLPKTLDGSDGCFRAPADRLGLLAQNDLEAIGAWLAAKAGGSASRPSATLRAYRKEAERLLLWAVLEKGKPLSSIDADEASAYLSFLTAPPASWCGPRHHQRWSPRWRPLEGPLSAAARCHAVTILKGLFTFLMARGYLVANPFAAAVASPDVRLPLGFGRTLLAQQWEWLDARLDRLATDEAGRRLARALRWLYGTGLRLGELTAARCGDLAPALGTEPGGSAVRWELRVTGPGRRGRAVPVPAALVAELDEELARHGRTGGVTASDLRDVAVLARFGTPGTKAWSASGAAKAIKGLFERLAGELPQRDADAMVKASAHWLRHSHAAHALQGRSGQTPPLPLTVVRRHLGHASLATTSGYLAAVRDWSTSAVTAAGDGQAAAA